MERHLGRRHPGRSAAAAAALAAALLSGCGGSGTASAPASTPAAGASSGVTASLSPSTAPSATGQSPSVSGAISLADLVSHVKQAIATKPSTTVTMKDNSGTSGTGLVRYADPLSLSMTVTSNGQRITMVLLGDSYYVNMGKKINGKNWLKVDMTGKDALSKAVAPAFASLRQQADLGYLPPSLRAVMTAPKPGPIEEGTPTVSYTFSLTAQQMMDALPADQRKLQAGSLAGTTSVTTFSIGPDWLPRQVTVVTTSKGTSSTSVMTYSKWGQPVSISAPPAADLATKFSA